MTTRMTMMYIDVVHDDDNDDNDMDDNYENSEDYLWATHSVAEHDLVQWEETLCTVFSRWIRASSVIN